MYIMRVIFLRLMGKQRKNTNSTAHNHKNIKYDLTFSGENPIGR